MAIDKPYKIGNLAYTLARQLLVKDKGGIASLPNPKEILTKVQDMFDMLKAGGYDPISAEKSIKSTKDLRQVLNNIEMKLTIDKNLRSSQGEGIEEVMKKMDRGIPLNLSDQAKMEGIEKVADDKVLDAFKGFTPKVIQGGKGKKGIEKLIKDGDVTVGTAPKTKTKDYKKIVELEEENMLADEERAKDFIDFSNRIKTMSPTDRVAERLKDLKGVDLSKLSGIEAQKIASELIGRKGPFKTISNKGAKEVLGELEGIIKRADAEPDLGTKLKNFDGDPDAMAQGGRIGFSGGGAGFAGNQMEGSQPGGQMDMPRNLGFQPIVPMPQTNIPGSGGMSEFKQFLQATGAPELGMGYNFPVGQSGVLGLSAAPSGNVGMQFKMPLSGGRFGFKDGSKPPNPGRRNFMKMMAGLASLPVVGKLFKPAAKVAEAGPAIAEGVKLGFDKFVMLVNKIKSLGKKTNKVTQKEREVGYTYEGKDGSQYELVEDLATGDVRVTKDKPGFAMSGDEAYDTIEDRSTFYLKRNQADETTKGRKPPDEYDEVKEVPSRDGTFDDIDEVNDNTVKEILEELSETKTKKASGGLAYMLGE